MSFDYYETLGVSIDSDLPQIKAAYHALSLKYHPDRMEIRHNPSIPNKAHTTYTSIQEAWATLSDPEKRLHYDNQYRNSTSNDKSTHYNITIDEFDANVDEESDIVTFTSPCRCSDHVTFTSDEMVKDGIELPQIIVICRGCSLRYLVDLSSE